MEQELPTIVSVSHNTQHSRYQVLANDQFPTRNLDWAGRQGREGGKGENAGSARNGQVYNRK